MSFEIADARDLDQKREKPMHKRFIEYDLPLAEISEQSAREKNIRHGHPSTLHIWWARRLSGRRERMDFSRD